MVIDNESKILMVYKQILYILVDYDYSPSKVIRLLMGYNDSFLNELDEYCMMQKDKTSESIRDYIKATKNWKKECELNNKIR